MKRFVSLLILILISKILFAQTNTIAEHAYIKVINDGPSTAPDFTVVTVNNLKTGNVKEICTDVTSLYWSLQQENNEKDYKKLKEYLLSKSSKRIFDLKDADALVRLNFDSYNLKNENAIRSIIINKHLTDSLKKFVKFRELLNKYLDDYRDKRQDILDEIADSITTKRPLSEEESKMIGDLRDRFYDDYYTKPIYNQYRKVSEQGENLMKIWNLKIKKHKTKILKTEVESSRMYYKFFQQYYKIYGINFCHIAFKYGIITYLGDENPVVGFGEVII